MNVLAPDCYVCRLMAESMKHTAKDDAYIVGFVTGYAEAITQARIDWVVPDVCEKHARTFEKVIASVGRQLSTATQDLLPVEGAGSPDRG